MNQASLIGEGWRRRKDVCEEETVARPRGPHGRVVEGCVGGDLRPPSIPFYPKGSLYPLSVVVANGSHITMFIKALL